MIFTGLTITLLEEFGAGLWVTFPLLLTLATVITLLGQVVGRKEGWSRFDSIYWSFITGTTVGFGGFRPANRGSRAVAIFIACLGLTLSGIVIAVAIHAGESIRRDWVVISGRSNSDLRRNRLISLAGQLC